MNNTLEEIFNDIKTQQEHTKNRTVDPYIKQLWNDTEYYYIFRRFVWEKPPELSKEQQKLIEIIKNGRITLH